MSGAIAVSPIQIKPDKSVLLCNPLRFHSQENCRCYTRRVAAGFATDITAYRSEFDRTSGTATGVGSRKGGSHQESAPAPVEAPPSGVTRSGFTS